MRRVFGCLALVPALFISASASALVHSSGHAGSAGLEFYAEPSHLSNFDEFLASRGLHAREEEPCIDLRGNVKAKDCKASLATNGFRGAFYYDDDKKSRPTKDTVVSRDAVVTEISEAQTAGKGKFTCDHILELNILKTVIMMSGGVCEKAKAMADQVDAKAKLEKIRRVVNRPENLVSFKSSVENIKTKNTQQFNKEVVVLPGTPLTFLVMNDYLRKTLSKTRQTASLLDTEIRTQFGADTAQGVASLWSDYLLFTQKKAVIKELEVRKEIQDKKAAAEKKAKEAAARKAACGANQAPRPGSPAPPTTGTRRRSLRSTNYLSSLDRRAARSAPAVRGASRSGPHAPAAPSCPLPGAPQKKVVPRSNMKTKPPPKKVPRAAAAKPKPKPVKPGKKVTPRPVNRPRRAAGKPKPKKKVTPKKKPKKVPKPPQKPKGKPRPRRRK